MGSYICTVRRNLTPFKVDNLNKLYKMNLRLLFLFLITIKGFSQISVSSRHIGPPKSIDKEIMARLKNTETIFLFSTVYEKETYEAILKDTWKVTPYKIVSLEDFNLENYLNDKYSFFQLAGHKRIKKTDRGPDIISLYTYIDLFLYDNEAIHKKLNKLSPEKKEKKFNDIIQSNTVDLVRFYIHPKEEFIHTSITKEIDEIVNSMYNDDVFYNYKPGFLKNYFQKINNLLLDEETYWLYKTDFTSEIKNLSTQKLYIPSYLTIKYNAWRGTDSPEYDNDVLEVFKTYDYEYEILSDQDISDKIIQNEEFYYLRYVRMNAERFLQIVNSKTGEVIYRFYTTGFGYKITDKHIKEINKKIREASK